MTMAHMTEKVIEVMNKYFKSHLGFKSGGDFHIVWFTKSLQNWKAMVIEMHTVFDGYYYEVTYNGDKKEAYIDVYKKQDNIVIPD